MATSTPNYDQGVAVDLASEAERAALLRQLEEHFISQRFSNNAAAFEAVKTYVLEWAAQSRGRVTGRRKCRITN